MNCKNCGSNVDGKFCSHCGQKSSIGRIDFTNFISELSEGVFQVNKGFFYTLRELFLRPGKTLKEFLGGKRKLHFKPIAYVLTLSTVYFMVAQFTSQSTWIYDIIAGWMKGATGQNSSVEIPSAANWFSKNYAYSTLLLLPVFSLASYLSFKGSEKNYLEHIVVNSYITGQQAIFYSLFALVAGIIENDVLELFPMFVASAYTFWVFWQLFSEGNRAMNIIRTMLTYCLYLIFSLVLLAILVAFYEFSNGHR